MWEPLAVQEATGVERLNIVVRSNTGPGFRGDGQYRERTNSRKHLLTVT